MIPDHVIRVVIVAGSRLYRDGLQQLLGARPELEVVATEAEGQAGASAARRERADVILVEFETGGTEGLRVLTQIPSPVVGLTIPETEKAVIACAEAGIIGFVPREGSIDDVVRAVQSAARGETACSPRVATILRDHVHSLATRAESRRPVHRLTSREREVVRLIDEGLSNKEIARRLVIEVATVKNHVHNILEKLQVRRRLDVSASLRAPAKDLVPGD